MGKNINLIKRSSNRQSNRPPTGPSNSDEDESVNLKEKKSFEKKVQKDGGRWLLVIV